MFQLLLRQLVRYATDDPAGDWNTTTRDLVDSLEDAELLELLRDPEIWKQFTTTKPSGVDVHATVLDIFADSSSR